MILSYFNKVLENKQLPDIKENTVVLFTAKGEWNSNGDMKFFREKSVNLKAANIIVSGGIGVGTKLAHFIDKGVLIGGVICVQDIPVGKAVKIKGRVIDLVNGTGEP